MGLGIRLRGFWQIRMWVAGCAAFALAVAVWSIADVSVFPPHLSFRPLEMASASTQVIVDTPQSTLVDIGQKKYGLEALTNRALLLGNVLASPEARAEIARRAHVPFESLQVIPPVTPDQPRQLVEAGQGPHVTDLVKVDGEYRLYVRANPTVPFLQLYAQAPTAASAAAVANAAVSGLQEYLSQVAQSTRTPLGQQIRLIQLGQARGKVINGGIRWQVALLVFVLAAVASCATVIWSRRVRAGWKLAALAERAS